MRKGIILAGGSGTRLYPMTRVTCKQLLPVYDKPMIYYPLATLMLAGIREVLIISTPEATPHLERLLGDGSAIGMHIAYTVQATPNGLAQAFVLGKDFIGQAPVCLILGDNIFDGPRLSTILREVATQEGATVFGYPVSDPERFGIVTCDDRGHPLSLEEKPSHPKSNIAVTGLYFYDNDVIRIAESLTPSARGEYEITDINKAYLEAGKLAVKHLDPTIAWFDTGTPEALYNATTYVRDAQNRQGVKIACIEEVALRMGFINITQFTHRAEKITSSPYGKYLHALLHHRIK